MNESLLKRSGAAGWAVCYGRCRVQNGVLSQYDDISTSILEENDHDNSNVVHTSAEIAKKSSLLDDGLHLSPPANEMVSYS